MPNQTYSLEWLNFANRHLLTAKLLIREKHFTDSIAIEIQQAIEKSFKAVYAYWGDPIPKTHSLISLHRYAFEKIHELVKVDTDEILTISDYYETDRYPGPKYTLPARNEVERFYKLAEYIYHTIYNEFVSN
jgi:HEPN domain-containing protein